MTALGGWYWFDEVYKHQIVLACCDPSDIPARVTEAVSDTTARDIILGDRGFGGISQVGCAARCVCIRDPAFGTATAIWLRPDASLAVVAHEAFHATFYVMEEKGIRLSDASEEAFAYYLEWLMRGILACLDGSTPPASPVTLEGSAG